MCVDRLLARSSVPVAVPGEGPSVSSGERFDTPNDAEFGGPPDGTSARVEDPAALELAAPAGGSSASRGS